MQCILTALHSTQRLNQEPMLHKSIGLEKEFKKKILYIYIKIKKEGFLQVDVLYESISKILTSSFCEYCESPGFSRGRH